MKIAIADRQKCKYSKCNNLVDITKFSRNKVYCNSKCQAKGWGEVNEQRYRTRVKLQNSDPVVKLKKRKWKEAKGFDNNATLIDQICFLCNSKDKLIIHHNDGNNGKRNNSLNNDSKNLIVLCRKCHPKIHNRWWRKDVYAYRNSR